VSKTPEQLRFAAELARAAEFRTALRRFLRRTEDVCSAHGLGPQTYDLLLLIEAAPEGRPDWTVRELGERLALADRSVTGVVTSAERARLLEQQDVIEGRVYRLRLTPAGKRRLYAAFRALHAERNDLLTTFEQADAHLRALSSSLEVHEARDL
jgi:DNA-binding MarR family transcriptional regulator